MSTWSMIYFQDSASPSMQQLITFHDFTMVIITMITILVSTSMLLIYSSKLKNKYLLQEQTIELIWTLAPIFILLGIALPSLQTLYLLDDPLASALTIKSTGHQWYWSYEYSDFPNIEFDSYMTSQNETLISPRLSETDNSVVLPTLTQIRMLTTGADVIHAWTVPSLGVKADAIPGRLNQMMFSLDRSGIFYGQCSELCGVNHSFMPIKIEAIPMNNFLTWANSMN